MTPQDVLDIMIKRDEFSKWLGLEIDAIALGYCRLHYTVKKEMLKQVCKARTARSLVF